MEGGDWRREAVSALRLKASWLIEKYDRAWTELEGEIRAISLVAGLESSSDSRISGGRDKKSWLSIGRQRSSCAEGTVAGAVPLWPGRTWLSVVTFCLRMLPSFVLISCIYQVSRSSSWWTVCPERMRGSLSAV